MRCSIMSLLPGRGQSLAAAELSQPAAPETDGFQVGSAGVCSDWVFLVPAPVW